MKPKLIFFGNSVSKFSNGLFHHFAAADCQIAAVVDTPAESRLTTSGADAAFSDFITVAKNCKIPDYAPDSPNTEEFVSLLSEYKPGALILGGYTKLIKENLLSVAKTASINFHASLLPAYKGKHPVFWAIRRGETFSGLTAHHLSSKLDEGSIAFQRAVTIAEYDSVEQVYDKVIAVGQEIVQELCAAITADTVPVIPQQGEGSYFSAIQPEDWVIRPTLTAKQICDMVRATPGNCYFEQDGKKTFVWEAKKTSPGTANKDSFTLATTDGYVELLALKKEEHLG